MHRISHCLPLISSSLEKVINSIETNQSSHDYFEVWLDYLSNVDTEQLKDLVSTYPNKIIFVSRRLNLDPITRPIKQRMTFLSELKDSDCLFDFDINQQREDLIEVKTVAPSILKLISYHNYSETPDVSVLEDILNSMQAYSPHISKLACFCNSKMDSINLLKVLCKYSQKRKIIILGMGANGIATRMLGCWYGNEFTFSPIDHETGTASGQLSYNQLDRIMEVLNSAGK